MDILAEKFKPKDSYINKLILEFFAILLESFKIFYYRRVMSEENGFLLGWPPFTEFKREMQDLLSEQTKPLEKDLVTVKGALLGHIEKTDKRLTKIEQNLTNHVVKTDKRLTGIEQNLTNHVTKTDKKVDVLSKDIKAILKK